MKNITFLLGAGASYNSYPIWKEQAHKMTECAYRYLSGRSVDFSKPMPTDLEEYEKLIWNIGYFGTKASKFGTIDTYAKKLYLNKSHKKLKNLKLAVSVFFTLWQLLDDKEYKIRKDEPYDEIDRRYITLFASILENISGADIEIKKNINFVTWNYDLQLELAYKSFCHDKLSWQYIFDHLKFRINPKKDDKLQICHLNGYHGFYGTRDSEESFIDVPESNDIKEILEKIDFLYTAQNRNSLEFSNHINYAWESNPLAIRVREEAKRIFQNTDILIIIGYSFPNFNKEIDKELFDKLNGRKTVIYYQDPNASETLIKQLVKSDMTEIICEKEKLDNFFLPYEF